MASFADFQGNEKLPVGTHSVKIVAVTSGTNRNGGVKIIVKFMDLEQREFDHSMTIQANAMWACDKFLRELGLTEKERRDIDFDKHFPENDIDKILEYFESKVKDRLCNIETYNKEFNGKDYMNLKSVTAFTGDKEKYMFLTGEFAKNEAHINVPASSSDCPF